MIAGVKFLFNSLPTVERGLLLATVLSDEALTLETDGCRLWVSSGRPASDWLEVDCPPELVDLTEAPPVADPGGLSMSLDNSLLTSFWK